MMAAVGNNISRSPAMSIDRIVLAFAGSMVLLSLVLTYFFSPYWLLLAAFVGLNLLQSAFTGFCPLAIILKKNGCPVGTAFH
jgi:fatty acid desaturase